MKNNHSKKICSNIAIYFVPTVHVTAGVVSDVNAVKCSFKCSVKTCKI